MSDDTNDTFYEWDDGNDDRPADPPIPDALKPYAGRRYIKVNSTKLSFAEYWRMSPGIVSFIIVSALKALRVRISLAEGIPYPDELLVMERIHIPPYALEKMAPIYDACLGLGFDEGFWYTIPSLGRQEGYGAAMRSADGEVAASILYSQTSTDAGLEVVSGLGFHTRFSDDRLYATANIKEQLSAPPNCIGFAMPKGNPQQVLEKHRHRIGNMSRTPIERIQANGLHGYILRINQEEADYHLARGVYEFLSRPEFEVLLEEKLAEHHHGTP